MSTLPGALVGILVPHIVCTLVILARTYSRLLLLRKWFLDDTLILLAWVCSTAVCIIYAIGTQSRDQHSNTATVTPETLRTYTSLILHQLTLLATKLSILTFYHRIFSPAPREDQPAGRIEKTLTRATMLFLILYGIPLLSLTILRASNLCISPSQLSQETTPIPSPPTPPLAIT
jgi:hypothetical protein